MESFLCALSFVLYLESCALTKDFQTHVHFHQIQNSFSCPYVRVAHIVCLPPPGVGGRVVSHACIIATFHYSDILHIPPPLLPHLFSSFLYLDQFHSPLVGYKLTINTSISCCQHATLLAALYMCTVFFAHPPLQHSSNTSMKHFRFCFNASFHLLKVSGASPS